MQKKPPTWARDELVVAWSFLLKNGRTAMRANDKRVIQLSSLLRNLPIHPPAVRDPHFRYANSVQRKLYDLTTMLPEYTGLHVRGPSLGHLVMQGFFGNEQAMHAKAEAIAAMRNLKPVPEVVRLLRATAKKIALLIAAAPVELFALEWRDVERVLHEVLEGLGYDVTLTRPAKDGGFDLKVVHNRPDGGTENYLLEIKHWTEPAKVGTPVYESFLSVVLREEADLGLLLSTSGFRPSLLRSRARISRRTVRLGSVPKIVQLCKSYEQVCESPWSVRSGDPDLLFRDTL